MRVDTKGPGKVVVQCAVTSSVTAGVSDADARRCNRVQ